MKKVHLGIAGVAVGALLATGCSSAADPARTNAAASVESGTTAADLNAFYAEDSKFYEPMRQKTEGALLVAPPPTVKAATGESTVVVSGKVGEVAAQRVIGNVQTMRVVLTDIDVLHGKLQPELGGKVAVELFLGEPVNVEKQIQGFQASLPKGYSIWFLRWQGNKRPVTKPGANPAEDPADASLYGVVHRHAVFAQGPDGVTNAIAEHDAEGKPMPGLQAEGEKLGKLSDLADQVRKS
ncbi:hypothetical protein [Actinoplanes sp. ATCC 53533]|uniref:hypothetical protein n=1 Tax=Actinoplanes sp. ATCC 53533 TaxID=1288362 RepID=UPI000F79B664|nr:hypothetical protein [Actinoplanes sp. ATCC 53533]